MHLQGDAPALVFRCAAAFRGLRAPRGLGFVKLSEHHAPFRMLRAGAGAINIPLQVYCACAFALGIRIRSSAWANPGGTIQGAFRVQPSNIQMKKLHDCEFWSSSGPLIRAMDCRLLCARGSSSGRDHIPDVSSFAPSAARHEPRWPPRPCPKWKTLSGLDCFTRRACRKSKPRLCASLFSSRQPEFELH